MGFQAPCYGHAAVTIGVGFYHGDHVWNKTLKLQKLDTLSMRSVTMDIRVYGYRHAAVTIGVGFYHGDTSKTRHGVDA